MGYKGKSKAKKGRGGGGGGGGGGAASRAASSTTAPTTTPFNFVQDAGPGCVIGHGANPAWALGCERIDPRDYPRGTEFPDLAVNPDDGTLSIANAHPTERVVRTAAHTALSDANCFIL
jgi:hypothetical protein